MRTNKQVFCDNDSYLLLKNGSKVNRAYLVVNNNDIISVVDRQKGIEYCNVLDRQYMSKNCLKYELAGGILLLPNKKAINPSKKVTILSKVKDGIYTHIEYDGVTHFTIENRDYIYRIEVPLYVDMIIKEENDIYIISYNLSNKQYLVVLRHMDDFIELLNVSGDSIIFGDDSIEVVNYYSDSLGRIRYDTYKLDGNKYKLINRRFEYTYSIVYDKSYNTKLLEDAVKSRDMEYVNSKLKVASSLDTLEEYFDSILGKDFDTLSIDDESSSNMHFIVNDAIPYVVSIAITYDNDGMIANMDRC